MSAALWIPSWFPTRMEPFAGDFIERHAKAASIFCRLQVIFVIKDSTLAFGKIQTEERHYKNGSGAWIYYYGAGAKENKIASFYYKIKLFSKAYKRFNRLHGRPSIVHLHVSVKNAWVALWISRKKNIPLIISEHWTGYLTEAIDEWKRLSFFQYWCIKQVLRRALYLTTVSEYLFKNIQVKFKSIPNHLVIPNVVDTEIFKSLAPLTKSTPQFIHISTLTPQKNFGEILEACSTAKRNGYSFQLVVYGPSDNNYKNEIKEMELEGVVVFKEEVSQTILSKDVAASKALILYSLFETFGCVIIEANSCGIPCILSDIEVFKENSIENTTAVRIPLHQPTLLAETLISLINNKKVFDEKNIILFANSNFSFEKIGWSFSEMYKKVIVFA